MRLFWRVFLANAAVLAVAAVVLALSPATVSFPIGPVQAAVLASGLLGMLVVNAIVLQRTLVPFERLVQFVSRVDPLRPGARLVLDEGGADLRAIATAINDMLERLESERRESAARQVMAQEAERRRVARELHDEIGQLLTAALLQLDHLAGRAPEELRETIAVARDALHESHGGVREIAQRLRPLALDDLGLVHALSALAAAYAKDTGLRVRREVTEEAAARLSEAEELVVYRVAQEALTNAARHARAHDVQLSLTADDGAVVLRVADDGVGLPADADGGTGIRGMRERALLVGASLELHQRGGAGTVVELRIASGRRGAAA